jgi:hypothetical protein
MKYPAWSFSRRRSNSSPGEQPERPMSIMGSPSEHTLGSGPLAISVRDLWMTYPSKQQGEPIHVLERSTGRSATPNANESRRGVH